MDCLLLTTLALRAPDMYKMSLIIVSDLCVFKVIGISKVAHARLASFHLVKILGLPCQVILL